MTTSLDDLLVNVGTHEIIFHARVAEHLPANGTSGREDQRHL
jgi:hypothetical protein